MDPLTIVLIGIVVPAAVALGVAVVGSPFTARAPASEAGQRRGTLVTGLALAGAYAVVFGLLLGWPALPPVDVTQSSPWLALVAVALGVGLATARPAWRLATTALFGVAIGAWLVSPLVPHALDGGLAALHVAFVAGVFVALDLGLRRGLDGLEPASGAGAVAAVAGGSALVVLLSDVASLGQVTGALAAAAGGLAALGLLRPRAVDARAASLVVAAILTTNLASAVLYAAGRIEVVALLALAPLSLVVARRWLTRSRRLLVRAVLPALVAGVPVAAAAAIAARAYLAPPAAPAHEGAATPASGSGTSGTGSGAGEPGSGYDPDYGY